MLLLLKIYLYVYTLLKIRWRLPFQQKANHKRKLKKERNKKERKNQENKSNNERGKERINKEGRSKRRECTREKERGRL